MSVIVERALADIEARLPGADARLRRSNLNVIALTNSGAVYGLYGYLEWLARQLMPDTAEQEWLERRASIYGIHRLAAFAASGWVSITGAENAVVPAGSTLIRAGGEQYLTFSDVSIVLGTATARVMAVVAGQSGNAPVGTPLTFDTPVPGIQARALTPTGISGGTDIETDSSLRARLMARIQKPPQGGANDDYVDWAKTVPGVTRVWVYPHELGPGKVTVRFVRDNDDDIIPDADEVAAVQSAIDAPYRRPVTATVTVVAPVPVPLMFTLDLLPDSPAARVAVEEELRDILRREAVPGGTILLTHIQEAVSLAAGEWDHVLVSPTTNVIHSVGTMAVFGGITWV